ncbi:C2 domain-containing protein 5 [Euwallacea similis]|uniref:C2 domain-containing protein 5 n=1 Tax=Euwallacea similis TaxID=1736056 RepID=UPI00344E03EF
MPGKVKVKIISGKNLPVMDRSSDTTDAYVEIKLGNTTYKTDVCRRTLHPQWNTDWYRFEVDDSELQDEPLQIRVMDHDTYSTNDAIGKVYLNLNPLLLPVAGQLATGDNNPYHEISGWIPVYDTMHGIRGEVNVTVKVELFSDFNRFRQSSCGVYFFYSPSIPQGYQANIINGFVEELIVDDDPEYQWIDKIRTPRASNEARQTLFFKLSGELQRKIGVKALALGGNAVIGYRQSFDFEGESGIVARGIGTAVTLVKLQSAHHTVTESKEEDIKNYLNFVGDGKSFSLCSSSPHHKIHFPPTYQPPGHIHAYTMWPSSSNPNLYSKSLNMKGLLSQEDCRGKSAMSTRFEKFKHSQKSLSKKMGALKAKINDSIGEESEADQSTTARRKLFKRTNSDSSAMAEILARSVMRATTSLSCILEDQSSFDKDDTLNQLKPVSDIIVKAESEEVMSDAHSYSSIESSSSCSEYEYQDYNQPNNDVETLSYIISNVEKMQKCLFGTRLHKQYSLPAIPTRGFSLSSLNSLSQHDVSHFTSKHVEHNRDKLQCINRSRQLERGEEIDLPEVQSQEQKILEVTPQPENRENICFTPKPKGWYFPSNIKPHLPHFKTHQANNSMVNIALKTMLFERANLVVTPTKETKEAFQFPLSSLRDNTPERESKGKVETGLQTMLVESTDILGTNKLDEKSQTDFEREVSGVGVRLEDQNKGSSLVQHMPENSDDLNIIAPVSLEKINMEPHKIVKTAMQTMLLEKFNLLGTYTPPTSPTANIDGPHLSRARAFTFNEPKKKVIPKVASSISLGHSEKMKDTVLGMPFNSLSSLKSEYDAKVKEREVIFLSETHLVEPLLPDLQDKVGAKKKRLKFLQSSGKRGSVFHKFRRASKKSLPDDIHKEYIHRNILARIFHPRHNEATVKDEETQTSNELLDNQNIYNTSSNSNSDTKINIRPPSPADIASGDFLTHSKTKSACITYLHSSPAQERQDPTETDNKEELGPEQATRTSHSPVRINYMVPLHRRSSDSDLSITPKGNSLTGSDKSMGNNAAYLMRSSYVRRGHMNQEHFDMLEYPFLTMTKFPPRFITQIGGSVSARSVKLLERILNVDEPESRDIWWSEIRMEIRSHARSLNCNAVLGYTELTSICEDVCVLSACGTAAVIDFSDPTIEEDPNNVQLIYKNSERDKYMNGTSKMFHESPDHRPQTANPCNITHLPYDEKTVPLKANVTKCPMCLKGKVPEVLIATVEPPESLPSVGRGCFIESHVSRSLKDVRGETIAKEISDGLPFLEYELHRLLVNKLKIKGMNAVFSLKIRISVGEKMLLGVATGTAIYLSCLPAPDLPLIVTGKDEKSVADLHEILSQTVQKNREIYQIKDEGQRQKCQPDEDPEEEPASLDISFGNKDCCILEMDDPEDAEVLKLLMHEKVPDGFHVVSTEVVLGLEDLEIVKNLQMFTQIYRTKLTPPYNLQKHFVRLLQSIYFKLRRMVPCALCDLQFRIDIPEPDEIQLCVIGMALGLGKKAKKTKSSAALKRTDDDLIFNIDDDHPQPLESIPISKSNPSSLIYRGHRSPTKYRPQSLKQRHIPSNERHGVDITPLSYVPGGNIEQYLGNLNFFFIRETTSIREEGGLSGFVHSFITEILAIVRSHVTALGGNALVAFFMTECILNHNLHKNQGQCLINVGGDVVSVSYLKDEP